MIVVRAAKNTLKLLRNHWRVSAIGFIAGAGAWLALGVLWPKQYIGSAFVTENLSLMNRQPPAFAAGEQGQLLTIAGKLKQTAAKLDWAAIASRYHPYPEAPRDGGPAHAATYLASQVSIAPAAEIGADVARISYIGSDRELVLGITTEVADGFTKPAVQFATPAAKVDEKPLYAEVILPDLPPAPQVDSSKHTRNRSRHESRSSKHRRSGAALASSTAPSPDAAELSAALQASIADGVKLQNALKQNASNLDQWKLQLNAQQKQIQSASRSDPAAITPPEHKPAPQEERLSQDLAKAQRELAILRDRYTDEYPDVVAATERVRDLLTDMSRISAAIHRAGPPEGYRPRRSR